MNSLVDYVGVPYVEKGRDPAKGLDCWGLLRWYYAREKGIELPSYADEASGRDRGVSRVVVNEIARRWQPAEMPEPGDAVVLRLSLRPFHVGVLVAEGKLLHTLGQHGSVIESLTGPKWASRIEGYYRYV